MASLKQIREAIAQTLGNSIDLTAYGVDLYTYERVEDMKHFPCIIIEPDKADYLESMQMGMVCWYINLWVCQSRQDPDAAQEIVDELIDSGGDNSVHQILFRNPSLGLGRDTDATVVLMKGYGGNFRDAGVPHVGALIQIRVMTDPRAR
jgi:hypothetical protein